MNPYLEGAYAPVREELSAFDLPVTGELPVELDGRYLRNGPNPLLAPDPEAYHWFTGDGMVHGVRLRDGRAEWYRNRFVRSTEVARALGEEPRPGPIHGGMDFAANTNVIGHAGRTFAIVEGGGNPYELTDELETVGPSDFDGTLGGGYTAHPKRDPATGELHSISYHWAWGNQVRYDVVGADGHVRASQLIDVGGPIMLHDMSLTERFAVVYDLPVVFDLEMVAAGKGFPYRWDPDYQARVGLVERADPSQVRWFEVAPCYVFHPMNAYDDGDKVVLDVVRHRSMFATRHDGPNEGPPTLDRWTCDLSSGKLLEERLDDRGQEFPRVDERVVGRRHRFGYTAGFIAGTDALVKHDLVAGTSELRRLPGDAGEAVFVPRAAAAAEDDGWLLTVVNDPERGAADLLVLNATDLTGEPQATVHLPARVPLGFHGNWVPTGQ
ncbi:MAG TPA: carotenoid oxygenase family protein [Mycobacteriales bacterium]